MQIKFKIQKKIQIKFFFLFKLKLKFYLISFLNYKRNKTKTKQIYQLDNR